ncbi:MAG: glycosyltransferase family 92 protein [Muribaculaceae bacterium]|nr:glycosyltransferase family 92 protein [Muribaculaceae bacterium]
MNKALAEIIAGVIPHKMTRNRWRGVLRYGVGNAMRLKNRLKGDTSAPRYYLAVCAIAKNEGSYMKEWIEWHRSKGVEKFYIYDNESTDCTKDVLAPYIESGLVEYTYQPGRKQQLAAYDDCFEKHRTDARWIAVIDLDEFIVPVKDNTIPDFLRRMEDYASVEINWLVYGSGGAKSKEPGGVMERFRKHSRPDHILNYHVKSIVDPRRVCSMVGCHEAARIEGKAGDSHGNRITRCFRDRMPQQDVIRINHYAVKSYEEFLQKRARGRARVNSLRDLSYFAEYDLNDIDDRD